MRKQKMGVLVWVLMMALGLLAGSIGDPGVAAARNITGTVVTRRSSMTRGFVRAR